MNFLSRLNRSIQMPLGDGIIDSETLDLCSIESPYPPSDKVEKALQNFDISTLNRFPNKNIRALKYLIARRFGLVEKNVFVYHGCDDLLSLCFKAFFNAEDVVAFADITNEYYPRCCKLNNVSFKTVAVNQEMKILLEDYVGLDCRGILICNPNEPTGRALNKLEIVDLVEKCSDQLIIVDERYVEFSNCSVASFVADYDNLLVLRSLDNAYGMAGIRFGYVLGNKSLIDGIKNLRYNMKDCAIDSITQTLAYACLEDSKHLSLTVDKIINTRENFADALRDMGFEVLPSNANFVFCKTEKMLASEIDFQLREMHIAVKQFKVKKIADYLRITIGTPEQMNKLLKALKIILK